MKTAKVWVEEVRVLWEHSAAWMALETLAGELEKEEGLEGACERMAGRWDRVGFTSCRF